MISPSMSAQDNELKRKLDSGKIVIGASCGLYSTTVIELYGEIGLDYIWIDLEHNGPSPWDSQTIEDFSRTADLADIEIIARLPSGESGAHPPLVRKVLDAGVRNIVIPRVETAEEVQAAAEATKFEYNNSSGERGFGVGRGTQWGKLLSRKWVEQIDDSILCGVMIENVTALDNLEEILNVPDLGFAFIGSMDLSTSLGHPAETGTAEFKTKIDSVADACNKADVPYGQLGAGFDQAASLLEDGAQLVSLGSDIGAIREVLDARRVELQDIQR